MSDARVARVEIAASFLAALPAMQVNGPTTSHRRQEAPKIIAIRELIELLPFRPYAESSEATEGDIFLIRISPGMLTEVRPCQFHQAIEVTLPQFARGRAIAFLERGDPVAYGVVEGQAKRLLGKTETLRL